MAWGALGRNWNSVGPWAEPGGILTVVYPTIGMNFRSISIGGTLTVKYPTILFTANSGGHFSFNYKIAFAGTELNFDRGSFAFRYPKFKAEFFSYPYTNGGLALTWGYNSILFTGSSTTQDGFTFTYPPFRMRLFEGNPTILVLNADRLTGPFVWDSTLTITSVFEYDNVVYLTTSAGVYKMSGGVERSAYFTIPENNFGAGGLLSMEEIILGIKGGIVKVQTHDGVNYSGGLNTTSSATKIENRRVKTGRGLRQRNWGAKISNVSLSAFEIDSVELVPLLMGNKLNEEGE